jgi:tRNA-Thr(GGU) m(6)t(6)A37 methyltransferase TsaA
MPDSICLEPIAFVKNNRQAPEDDFWGGVISEIVLAPGVPEEAVLGLDAFSHIEVIFFFDKVDPEAVRYSGHPRGNKDYPLTGILAQRKKDRPNRIGLCTAEIVGVKGRAVTVRRLDAINGTPVLDIKPVLREFQPKGQIRQPYWATELMQQYWKE